MKFKFVIIEINQMELPVIFSPLLAHEDISVCGMQKIKSAGYCEIGPSGRWVASGQSISLKLNARPEDSGILNAQLSPPPYMFARLARIHAKS